MAIPQVGSKVVGPGGSVYDLAQFLGRGGFGEVYRAVDSAGQSVAVKFINHSYVGDSQVVFSLLNEARSASRIEHENVLRLVHVGDSAEYGPYLVSEFADGGTLERQINRQRETGKPFAIDYAVGLMLQIGLGCQAINNVVIHRDLKPDNIFFLGSTLKVADFGISKVVDETTRSHTFKGIQHIRYKSPESWRFETNTAKIDIYSVGLIFYEVLSLVHPLDEAVTSQADWREWESAHLTFIPKSLRSVRPEVGLTIAQLVDRMIAKRPSDRPEWSEILQRLNSPVENQARSDLDTAVALAVQRKEERQRQAAETEKTRITAQQEIELYKTSCELLLGQWREIVDEFNTRLQGDRIEIQRRPNDVIYRIVGHSQLNFHFFDPPPRAVDIRNRQVIGGGWLGIHEGVSGNLVLIRDSQADLYGTWSACLVNISALASGRNLIGRFGITNSTWFPMGFRSSTDFYDQIRYLGGGMHVFNYEMHSDIRKFFIDFVETALKR
jgi:eukaryotic-like serine/threonine-protein kinase